MTLSKMSPSIMSSSVITASFRSCSSSATVLKCFNFLRFLLPSLNFILVSKAFWLSSSGWSCLNSANHFALSAANLSSRTSSFRSYLTFSAAWNASLARSCSSRSSRYVFCLCFDRRKVRTCRSQRPFRYIWYPQVVTSLACRTCYLILAVQNGEHLSVFCRSDIINVRPQNTQSTEEQL